MENNDIIDTVTEQGGGGPYNAWCRLSFKSPQQETDT